MSDEDAQNEVATEAAPEPQKEMETAQNAEVVPEEPVTQSGWIESPTDTNELQNKPENEPPTVPESVVENPSPSVTMERKGDTVTITEVMAPPETKNPLKNLFGKLKEKLRSRTEKRLSKILEFVKEKDEIQNDNVEKLLHVSHATATRYLSELVKQGKLVKEGSKGHEKYKWH